MARLESSQFIIQDSAARIGGLSDTYYQIAEESFALFLDDEQNLIPEAGPDDDPTKKLAQEHRMRVAGIKSIVFSAMCLEAAAFDFSAIQLGDNYTEQYLDKLDLVSKWMVITQLVCGRSLKDDGPALNGLRNLARSRNALVHQKSKPFKLDPTNLAGLEKNSNAFPGNVHNAFKSVVLLSLELHELIGHGSVLLRPFEKGIVSSRRELPKIKKVIEECRVIHRGHANKRRAS